MAESIRYLFLDTNSSREIILNLGGDFPKVAEQFPDVFGDGEGVYEVVGRDPQPFILDGEIIPGGRVWVRHII